MIKYLMTLGLALAVVSCVVVCYHTRPRYDVSFSLRNARNESVGSAELFHTCFRCEAGKPTQARADGERLSLSVRPVNDFVTIALKVRYPISATGWQAVGTTVTVMPGVFYAVHYDKVANEILYVKVDRLP